MAQYTTLNHPEVETIMAQYGVKPISTFKVLSGGSENTNYEVKSSLGHFVLTICEQKTSRQANELATLLSYLIQHGLATSKPVQTLSGEWISIWENKPIILKAFIEGDVIEDLSKNLLIALGQELAKLHQLEAPDYLPKFVNYGVEKFGEIETYAPGSAFSQWLKNFSDYLDNHLSVELPRALIHSDLFSNNVIINPNRQQVTIMDYEEACHYYRVFDVGMTLIGTCSERTQLNLSKASWLLEGYQQKARLLEIEKSALQAFTAYAAAATAFWRHQHFNHVNIDPHMKDHYQMMKNLADQVMEIPEKDFRCIFTGIK